MLIIAPYENSSEYFDNKHSCKKITLPKKRTRKKWEDLNFDLQKLFNFNRQ